MADALVSIVKDQVQSAVQQEIKLIVGVDDELYKISITLSAIQKVLKDAEKRQANEGDVKVWLDELKDCSYDIEDVLDEWSTRTLSLKMEVTDTSAFLVQKVCTSFRCFCLDEDVLHRVLFFLSRFGFNQLILRHNIAHRIKHIRNRLDWIAGEKDQYHFKISDTSENSSEEELEQIETSSVVNISTVFGRASDKDDIISKLLSESSCQSKGLPVISIVGMGGLGKTTLARLVFRDEKVKAHFGKTIWVCVSDPFRKTRIAKAIIEGSGEDVPNVHSWQALHQHMCQSLEGKLFLLVLDNVWTEDYQDWEPFRDSLNYGAPGSRVVVTTRNMRVAMMMDSTHIHELETLSQDDTRALLNDIALSGRGEEASKELEQIGKNIALKCKGLPLAAKTIGSLLRFKKTVKEWLNVLENEIWISQGAEEDVLPAFVTKKKNVLPALLLSYYDLPSPLKRCFEYCAVFPKGRDINGIKLIRIWMAQGLLSAKGEDEMEKVGREYLDNLLKRSLLRRSGENYISIECNMHDFVHDLVQFLAKKKCIVIQASAESGLVELGCCDKSRHLTLQLYNIVDVLPCVSRALDLPSILGTEDYSRSSFQNSFPIAFRNLTCLRSLDLSFNGIENLPSEIEKLIHLRCLDLSFTNLKELPEAVSKLQNLQTLDLSCCTQLVKLPQGIVNMRKIRHLDISYTSSLTYLPKGIGRLDFLRTLTRFIVSGNGDGCGISELKNLNRLSVHLQIEGLGNVRSRDEARESELWNKTQIERLILVFDGNAHDGNEMCESVLEGLQLPPNLEFLQVRQYPGTKFPTNWITWDDGSELSSNLRELKIHDCKNCLSLSLPQLPSLGVLEISGLERVRVMGRKFFGIRDDDDDNDVAETREMQDGDDDENDEDVTKIMPNLYLLSLVSCSQLKVLPRNLCHQLRNMCLQGCPTLYWRTSSCLQLPLLVELILSGDVGVLSESLSPTLISLPALESLTIIKPLRSSLPEGLCHLTALRYLQVPFCDNVNDLSEELQHSNTIQELRVSTYSKEREKEVRDNLSKILNIPCIYLRKERIRWTRSERNSSVESTSFLGGRSEPAQSKKKFQYTEFTNELLELWEM